MGSNRWTKLGRIFVPPADHSWMRSHAQIPTALLLADRIRIYFATRPAQGYSVTTFLDVDRRDPRRVLHVHHEPVLTAGEAGQYDEHGIMPSCALHNNGQVWLYVGGWSRRERIPYSNWTGIAVSDDAGVTFRRLHAGPVVDRTPEEVFSATAVNVLKQADRWHMWYASGAGWVEQDGRLEEVYRIRYGSSQDGITWQRPNEELLPWQRTHEPTHRPSIFLHDGVYHMWFCHRGITDFRNGSDAYRLGYARSIDGAAWSRDDAAAGMDVTPGAWDSDMIAYPYVIQVDDRLLMFYNGSGFGASGFGVAALALKDLR